ncbi:hypothetical protein Psi02_28490 [Planotetraspora silvatica]|uniref:WYL domain-containing protein n=1 Tax=Planotetraspora silvatica TaxID=234614 RepID=A0A8J3UXT2_9ACTN|nr:hypothetical protein Psi02_28490 [Planotetraspora silvatica]
MPIRTAIAERHRLEFSYKGLPRTVTPWALGITKDGVWRVRAAQVGGFSSSGRAGDDLPKLFDVAGMSGLVLLPEHFEVPLQYRQDDSAFVRLDIQL